MKCIHAFISGRVQGVFYRYSCREEAVRIGLGGWVSNLADGRVEAVAEGAREDVEKLIAWCRKGPRGASVSSVDVSWEEPKNESSFAIL